MKSGLVGVGGSPGESVAVKCGIIPYAIHQIDVDIYEDGDFLIVCVKDDGKSFNPLVSNLPNLMVKTVDILD